MRLGLDGVTVGYDAGPVLTAAEVTLDGQHRWAVLGANGSGKTTLLKALSGALRPRSGRVLVDDAPLRHGRAALRAHRRLVQLVLQDPDDQLFAAEVGQDVSFGPMNLGLSPAEVGERVGEALALLGISHLRERPVHQLSFGERRRVSIAGAVAMRPRVLLLDEPSAGLDPQGVAELVATLELLRGQGSTLVMSTHDVQLALAWADRVAIVHDGVVTAGPAIDLLADDALLRAARLTRPWPLELAARLRAAGRLSPGPAPRTLDEVLKLLG
ncbi:ATP-binding cassette domain-containing protein [Naumannella sp. ID2617S]|uniref:ABC transporter ATP-binding protein n=1 Tax=Enemella dayhoffiae TaxID=2016507 RepID=A0A255H9I2_9ACTN|nr:ATP-binding cassette domain-containing protein [Enemella dayhoffiae]NNG20848.1 ATP-binding cassette domain-containing protein [Naumannella sp. ID2617S]OYO24102.1 cobalt ABC transporter ATP-binding protein [Enemella dayhoffiae]